MDEYEQAVTRRELLRLGLATSVAAIWRPAGILWAGSRWDIVLRRG